MQPTPTARLLKELRISTANLRSFSFKKSADLVRIRFGCGLDSRIYVKYLVLLKIKACSASETGRNPLKFMIVLSQEVVSL